MDSRELFEIAIEVVLGHEGGYSDHPDDHGGRTMYGISERAHPGLADAIPTLSREEARQIYWERYWHGRRFDRLPQALAIKIFDLAVNMGERRAVACLQYALRACQITVMIDGILGPQTEGASLEAPEEALLAAIRSEAAGEYRQIIARDPSQAVFEIGWLARAYS